MVRTIYMLKECGNNEEGARGKVYETCNTTYHEHHIDGIWVDLITAAEEVMEVDNEVFVTLGDAFQLQPKRWSQASRVAGNGSIGRVAGLVKYNKYHDIMC